MQITSKIPQNMITQINKKLILLSLTSVELHKPPLCHSISLLFYSSSRLEKPKSKSKISVSEYLITQHQFSPEAALKAASTIAFLKSPADSSSVISFLRESGFSKTHMEDVIKRVPRILTSNLDTVLKPKFKVFQDLGFSDSDIVDIVSSDPWILWRSADNRLAPALLVLKKILGSNARVLKALKLPGWFLKYDLEKTMMSNVEVLQSYGIKSPQIIKYIFQFPRFFVHKPESIVEVVKRVDEMGFDMKSKRFLSAIRIMTSLTVDTWERKVKLFKSLGLSEDDISAVFRRVPQVFAVSENKIKEVTELLLSTGKFDISFIVNRPELLIYSVEHRLKPRLRVMEILEKKKLLGKKHNLITICKYSKQKFAELYVIPYANELEGRVHEGKS
ncbi:uncharacterized protein LOC103959053 isoform X1 [Pyrus x bretschneideri]|uniref:uncharacterized protein LOC103959053 isoform X1 n=2 Tax=Pyrus x bretschneideri TaxID=225117 RepID=UPI000511ACFD|nr:uncharacterized protein LOC103959053 isoform X1 [Pyrus x bretschneideri]